MILLLVGGWVENDPRKVLSLSQNLKGKGLVPEKVIFCPCLWARMAFFAFEFSEHTVWVQQRDERDSVHVPPLKVHPQKPVFNNRFIVKWKSSIGIHPDGFSAHIHATSSRSRVQMFGPGSFAIGNSFLSVGLGMTGFLEGRLAGIGTVSLVPSLG